MSDISLTTHRTIPPSQFITAELWNALEIGPCDEVIFPGLFSHHAGNDRNIPIVRRGTIAAIPGEKVTTERMGKINAFLMEARSIGGLSGSPVFVHLGENRVLKNDPRAIANPQRDYLIGLVHGHF